MSGTGPPIAPTPGPATEVPSNLPAAVTSFVGRADEIAALCDLLANASTTTRLITLTGAGGVGKTRLALEVATQVLRAPASPFPDGVWLVELAVRAGPACRRIALRQAIDAIPRLAERVRAGRREEPLRGMADLPMFLRKPHGPGWALVGDAGCRVDPITGRGITDAFRDAELLADAIVAGLGGVRPISEALREFQGRRDTAVLPMYRYTAQRATLQPPSRRCTSCSPRWWAISRRSTASPA